MKIPPSSICLATALWLCACSKPPAPPVPESTPEPQPTPPLAPKVAIIATPALVPPRPLATPTPVPATPEPIAMPPPIAPKRISPNTFAETSHAFWVLERFSIEPEDGVVVGFPVGTGLEKIGEKYKGAINGKAYVFDLPKGARITQNRAEIDTGSLRPPPTFSSSKSTPSPTPKKATPKPASKPAAATSKGSSPLNIGTPQPGKFR